MRRTAHYRIYVVGDLPADLKDRIAALHAGAILKMKNEAVPVNTQNLDSNISRAEDSIDSSVQRDDEITGTLVEGGS